MTALHPYDIDAMTRVPSFPRLDCTLLSLVMIASVCFATWHGAWMLIQVFGR